MFTYIPAGTRRRNNVESTSTTLYQDRAPTQTYGQKQGDTDRPNSNSSKPLNLHTKFHLDLVMGKRTAKVPSCADAVSPEPSLFAYVTVTISTPSLVIVPTVLGIKTRLEDISSWLRISVKVNCKSGYRTQIETRDLSRHSTSGKSDVLRQMTSGFKIMKYSISTGTNRGI